jgi:hypothetical protein
MFVYGGEDTVGRWEREAEFSLIDELAVWLE